MRDRLEREIVFGDILVVAKDSCVGPQLVLFEVVDLAPFAIQVKQLGYREEGGGELTVLSNYEDVLILKKPTTAEVHL